MSSTLDEPTVHELDVRGMRKPDKHPTIFRTYRELPLGGAFVLINDHDPKHLHDEFETDYAGGFGWEYLNREIRDWRIRITKLSSGPLPRVLVDTTAVLAESGVEAHGAVWALEQRECDLDSNLIALPPDKKIDAHVGPDVDVLILVLAGAGLLVTESGEVHLAEGSLAILPRRSQRAFVAGPEGLRYLTVHQKRQSLELQVAGLPTVRV